MTTTNTENLINHLTAEVARLDKAIAQHRESIAKTVARDSVHHPLDTARLEDLVQYLRSADGKRAALVDTLHVVKTRLSA